LSVKRLVSALDRVLPLKALQWLRRLRFDLAVGYRRECYSQEGEDRILWRLFEEQERGFYVDVGAHHPIRFSNTFLFYRAGWSGINCDATPGSMAPFARIRPRDINLELAISDAGGALSFYGFDEPALNTFDPKLATEYSAHARLIQRKTVPTVPLREVLTRYLPAGTPIDFMSVDVEGFDLSVLRSNDWTRYRPTVLLVECAGVSLAALDAAPLGQFVKAVGYQICAKTVRTTFFKDQQ
jgi:FkbM family methyltransferase